MLVAASLGAILVPLLAAALCHFSRRRPMALLGAGLVSAACLGYLWREVAAAGWKAQPLGVPRGAWQIDPAGLFGASLVVLALLAAGWHHTSPRSQQHPLAKHEDVWILFCAGLGVAIMLCGRLLVLVPLLFACGAALALLPAPQAKDEPYCLWARLSPLIAAAVAATALIIAGKSCDEGFALANLSSVPPPSFVSGARVLALLFLGLMALGTQFPFCLWPLSAAEGASPRLMAFVLTGGPPALGPLLLLRIALLSHDRIFPIANAQPYVSAALWLVPPTLLVCVISAFISPEPEVKLAALGSVHFGYVFFALFCTMTGAEVGLAAVAHTVVARQVGLAAAFFALDWLRGQHIARHGGLEFLEQAHRAPVCTIALLGGLVCLAGIPPLAGFWGKWLTVAAMWSVAGRQAAWLIIPFSAEAGALGWWLLSDEEHEARASAQPSPAHQADVRDARLGLRLLLLALLAAALFAPLAVQRLVEQLP